MTYTPPSRADLRNALARDLRDPDLKTFTDLELNDLINQALVEVGRVYPKQEVQELAVAADGQEQYPCDAKALFRVEVIVAGQVVRGIAQNNHALHGQNGWDLHGGTLFLPLHVRGTLKIAESPTIRVWGYWAREVMQGADPLDDEQLADTDAEAEFGVRTYASLMGYQRLQNDRLLFQQWLTNTGNSDVSPNQLAQTADMYMSQWREMRQRLRAIQRS
jgi:hypothetical protein